MTELQQHVWVLLDSGNASAWERRGRAECGCDAAAALSGNGKGKLDMQSLVGCWS
jgi:hypothetical protein